MMKAANDNSETWESISAVTERLLVNFHKKTYEETDGEKDTRDTPVQRTNESAADIERRIKDILAMENRLRRKKI